ncbi:MAG: hypothetical protein JWQ97_350 [Phenylobacterium sp.]|nr:hypothetical protein [Phenylobacterium sp.]
MPRHRALHHLKPFAWLALVAFLVGFMSYAVLGEGSHAAARVDARYVPVASAPASDDWNLPKHI